MATYIEWNNTIVWYFTHRVPRGSGVFLSIDDSELHLIADHIPSSATTPMEDPVRDFTSAIRSHCKRTSNGRSSVNLAHLLAQPSEQGPLGVGFLAAMVLAASYMEEIEGDRPNNYFSRLRDVLGMNDGDSGRPAGMKNALESEIPIWQQWDIWIQDQGFLPTTIKGEGPMEYVNIPISQSLLRRSDREKLKQLFDTRDWRQDRDKDTLYHQVARDSWMWTKHLARLIDDPGLRYESLQDGVFDTWQEWLVYGSSTTDGRTRKRGLQPGISLKIYRTEDPLEGINYSFYPEPTYKWQEMVDVRINTDDGRLTISEGQPGRYLPLPIPISEHHLNDGCTYSAEGHPSITSILHSPRKFWILVSDPEDPGSGIRAAWGPPVLGEPFVLLFDESIKSDLDALRDELMIDWKSEPVETSQFQGWMEISDCSVISVSGWKGVFPAQHRELLSALSPTSRISIVLSEGLRLPNNAGWIVSHGPKVYVTSLYSKIDIEMRDVRQDNTLWRQEDADIHTSGYIDIPWSEHNPGTYQIIASAQGSRAIRNVILADWDELEPSSSTGNVQTKISDTYHITGANLISSNEV